MGSFFIFFFVWGGVRIPPEGLRVTFLDVGQGDATLIEFSNGKTVLVDGGSKGAGKFAVAPYLWERRIRRIDYLISSHPQADHIGGLPYLIRRFQVKALWSSGLNHKSAAWQAVLRELGANKSRHHIVSSETPALEIDGCSLKVLHPRGSFGLEIENKNNQSLVLRLSCPRLGGEGISFLLTGDIEAEAEAALMEAADRLPSTILKVAHHGSRSSTGKRFVAAVSPEVAAISAGRHNRYGHPHPEVLEALAAPGTRIYRTDHSGAIVLEARKSNSGNIESKHLWSYRDRKVEKIQWNRNVSAQEWRNIGNVLAFFSR